MKLYLDENLTPELQRPLTRLYRHGFRTPQQEKLSGVEDLRLFQDLADRDFNAIITKDKKQLEDSGERDGLRAAGLHWIGVGEFVGYALSHSAALTWTAQHLQMRRSPSTWCYVVERRRGCGRRAGNRTCA